MHCNKFLSRVILVLLLSYCSKAGAQTAQSYFVVPASDTGANFSDSQFQTILPTGTGYVSLGLCKTISLTQMCTGIVASFKDANGKLTSYHRYFDCDSVASVGGASGIITPDGDLVMAYMAFQSSYPTGQGDMYLYIIKASIAAPGNYSTRRVVIPASYAGSGGFDITRSSTRIVRHADGSYNVLVPSVDRMNLCHLNNSLQVLSTKEFRLPAGQGGPYHRLFDVGFSNMAALPSGDVLAVCAYQVIDTITLMPAGSGTVVCRATNGGSTHYVKAYESSPAYSSSFISTVSQMYALSGSKVVCAGVAGGPALFTINPADGSISNGKYIQPPAPANNDSNNYSEHLGIVKSGNSFLVYRTVKNYSLALPYDQLGVIKADTNLALLASKKFSYKGIYTLFSDNGTSACLSNDSSGIVMSLAASGYGKDSTMQETGEVVAKVDAASLSSACAERVYTIPDQLVSMGDPTPAGLTVNIVSSGAYTATVRSNIQHDTATAFYQRNLCLSIPGHNPTAVHNPSLARGLRVFPNPATGIIRVETTGPVKTAEVYSLIGARVLSADMSVSKSLDCSSLVPGHYLIKVTCNSGQVITQKFCRQ